MTVQVGYDDVSIRSLLPAADQIRISQCGEQFDKVTSVSESSLVPNRVVAACRCWESSFIPPPILSPELSTSLPLDARAVTVAPNGKSFIRKRLQGA